jgi:hypothetical protein
MDENSQTSSNSSKSETDKNAKAKFAKSQKRSTQRTTFGNAILHYRETDFPISEKSRTRKIAATNSDSRNDFSEK